MTAPETPLERYIDGLPGAALGVRLRGDVIMVDGASSMGVPQTPAKWQLHEAPSVWPNVPHGDPRPTLLSWIVKDAGTGPPGTRLLSGRLRDALDAEMPGRSAEVQKTMATAMKAKFWTTAGSNTVRDREREFLLPLHSDVAQGFDDEKAGGGKTSFPFKMFRGTVLSFLLSLPGGGVDEGLMNRFLQVFSSEDDLTVLDREVLEIARRLVPGTAGPSTATLLATSEQMLHRLNEAGGGFCPPSLKQFRADLQQVLTTALPRRDQMQQISVLLALHLSTRLYRAGLVLSLQLDQTTAMFADTRGLSAGSCTSGCCGVLEQCDLASRLRFRTGSGSSRRVSLAEPCITSYREITSGYLMPLPVTITAANLARLALQAAGGPLLAPCDLPGLHRALDAADQGLRDRFDAVTRLLGLCRRHQLNGSTENEYDDLAEPGMPGFYVLRQALLQARRNTMRHEGRDVVHQLVKIVPSGYLIRSNGNAYTYFEIDEEMLHLLVRLVCKDELIPYRHFLQGLTRYGLAPQSGEEDALLQQALSRLGMLKRYSDAGESAYVHYTTALNEDEDEEER